MNDTSQTRTKIIATLGPASWEVEMIEQLLEAGVDCFRINCSHADHDSIRRQVSRVRRVSSKSGHPVALLLDLQGPKIRVAKIEPPISLSENDTLTIVMREDYDAHDHTVGTTFPGLADEVSVGDLVMFADGALSGTVSGVHSATEPARVEINMTVGGTLSSNKGINLPNVALRVPALTEKDKADLAVGTACGVDYVALSFVRRAQDMRDFQEELRKNDALGRVLTIAKIEKPQAVEALDEILALSDGVMVARGDLGVEVPLERVPIYQKQILERARALGKISITATQMLDSMERNPRPTRAETTDVANAILDGTDVNMLSGETAIGDHPVLAVKTMNNIAWEAERSKFFGRDAKYTQAPMETLEEVVVQAASFATNKGKRPLCVYTWTGRSAQQVSKARIPGVTYALTPFDNIIDRLSLMWGVVPVKVPLVHSIDELMSAGEARLLELGLVTPGQEVVSLCGKLPMSGAKNIMKLHRIGEE
jgi:pyruvate kinase